MKDANQIIDQSVGSSVMKTRVVTVSGVTWTFSEVSHSFGCGTMEEWDRYRLGHRAEHPGLMYSQATVRPSSKGRAVLRWDHTLKRGRI